MDVQILRSQERLEMIIAIPCVPIKRQAMFDLQRNASSALKTIGLVLTVIGRDGRVLAGRWRASRDESLKLASIACVNC